MVFKLGQIARNYFIRAHDTHNWERDFLMGKM